MGHVQHFPRVAPVKRTSLRPATVGLPSVEAAMQRARAQELAAAKARGRSRVARRLLWLATGVAIGFTGGWFGRAQAADYSLIGHVAARHGHNTSHFGRDYNERTWGVGLRAALSPTWSVQAGQYRNSHHLTSRYALVDWTPADFIGARAGLFAGIATNYVRDVRTFREPCAGTVHWLTGKRHVRYCERTEVDTKLQPAAGALLRWTLGRGEAVLRAIPPIEKASGVVAVELGWRV